MGSERFSVGSLTSSHKMGLDQTRRDPNLSLHEPLVDLDHGAPASCADVCVVLVVASKMIDARYGLFHPFVPYELA